MRCHERVDHRRLHVVGDDGHGRLPFHHGLEGPARDALDGRVGVLRERHGRCAALSRGRVGRRVCERPRDALRVQRDVLPACGPAAAPVPARSRVPCLRVRRRRLYGCNHLAAASLLRVGSGAGRGHELRGNLRVEVLARLAGALQVPLRSQGPEEVEDGGAVGLALRRRDLRVVVRREQRRHDRVEERRRRSRLSNHCGTNINVRKTRRREVQATRLWRAHLTAGQCTW